MRKSDGIVVNDSTTCKGMAGNSSAIFGTFAAIDPPVTTINEPANSAIFLNDVRFMGITFLPDMPKGDDDLTSFLLYRAFSWINNSYFESFTMPAKHISTSR